MFLAANQLHLITEMKSVSRLPGSTVWCVGSGRVKCSPCSSGRNYSTFARCYFNQYFFITSSSSTSNNINSLRTSAHCSMKLALTTFSG